MTLLDEMQGRAGAGTRSQGGGASGQQSAPGQQQQQQQQGVNVGPSERAVSVAAGSILAMLGVSRRSIPGLLMAGVGAAMVQRGVTGHCSAYEKLGLNTADESEQQRGRDREDLARNGIHVEQAFLINRPAEDLYNFWHNFSNLPTIMKHLKSVTVDGNRSHWVAEAPTIAGGTVEWDAEITRDEPGQAIAWRSLPGSQVQSQGEVRFSKAMGDRGTEVHVYMDYRPPAGKLGHWIATMFGENPRRQMREDIRNFKRLMECGEIITVVGQPVGTCLRSGGSRATS